MAAIVGMEAMAVREAILELVRKEKLVLSLFVMDDIRYLLMI